MLTEGEFMSMYQHHVERLVNRRTLPDLSRPNAPIDKLFDTVCRVLNITSDEMTGPYRDRACSYPRHIFCFLAWYLQSGNFTSIGEKVNKNRTTAINAKDTALELFKARDPLFLNYWYTLLDNAPAWLLTMLSDPSFETTTIKAGALVCDTFTNKAV